MKQVQIFFILVGLSNIFVVYDLHGKVIALSGISGSGKSTLARILANECQAECMSEPEEVEWSVLVKDRESYGSVAGFLWFRLTWTKLFTDAQIVSKQGKLVFIDTYFLKTNGYSLGQPGMEWLVPFDDPYLPFLKDLAILDQKYVPNVDYVVFLEIDFDDWKKCLQARARDYDCLPGFDKSYELQYRYVKNATIDHCQKYSIPIIYFKQTFETPQASALRLKKVLVSLGIVE